MLHILSPAKSLDYKTETPVAEYTLPKHKTASEKLIRKLSKTSAKQLKSLMGISDQLVTLNKERYQQWEGKEALDADARQALFAFSGDVYLGLDAYTLSQESIQFAQEHLRILSGLYGVLKPLDLIEPYRLEMGTSLKVGRKENLYDFWGSELQKEIAAELEGHKCPVLVNLASNEYAKVLKLNQAKFQVISPQFMDAKNGKYKIISFFAKKARGMMSRYLIENQIDRVEDLQGFTGGSYRYNSELSQENKPVFTREENES